MKSFIVHVLIVSVTYVYILWHYFLILILLKSKTGMPVLRAILLEGLLNVLTGLLYIVQYEYLGNILVRTWVACSLAVSMVAREKGMSVNISRSSSFKAGLAGFRPRKYLFNAEATLTSFSDGSSDSSSLPYLGIRKKWAYSSYVRTYKPIGWQYRPENARWWNHSFNEYHGIYSACSGLNFLKNKCGQKIFFTICF